MRRPLALISGASSGIGFESAHQLAALGYDLIVIARRKEILEDLERELFKQYHTKTHVLALDLLDEKAVFSIVSYLRHNWLSVDLLINNAGFGDYGRFRERDIKKLENMVNLNVMRLMQLTYHVLPFMNPKGHICNVGSLASFMAGPYMNVYYASKSFVLNFSLGLAQELKDDELKVSVFVPGPVNTEFNQVAQATKKGQAPFSMKMLGAQDVKSATSAMLKGIEKGKAIIYSKKQHALLVGLIGMVPASVVAKVMKQIQQHRFVKE